LKENLLPGRQGEGNPQRVAAKCTRVPLAAVNTLSRQAHGFFLINPRDTDGSFGDTKSNAAMA
jgi:hypothetical protein